MTIIEAILETFPASKMEESSPKIETTPDQWERGKREITKAREVVIALIKANAEKEEENAKVPQAGRKETPEPPKSITQEAPQTAPNEEKPLKQPPLAESTQYLTLEQETALAAFLEASGGNETQPPFDSQAFLGELEKEKDKLNG